ncbi:hypothetical protein Amsp01_043210 [Amycolatopsis sp. NBRC 101858]|nr:hypothetical protein Amsp01_043210 [Amycolatopsis sp. NBRC 101858]
MSKVLVDIRWRGRYALAAAALDAGRTGARPGLRQPHPNSVDGRSIEPAWSSKRRYRLLLGGLLERAARVRVRSIECRSSNRASRSPSV